MRVLLSPFGYKAGLTVGHRRFHADSDDEREGDEDFGLAEQEEEEEEREALNPYRQAYVAGYMAADQEEGPQDSGS